PHRWPRTPTATASGCTGCARRCRTPGPPAPCSSRPASTAAAPGSSWSPGTPPGSPPPASGSAWTAWRCPPRPCSAGTPPGRPPALAAPASGALAAALELTPEHVRTRRQFGRALAELQAVTMKVGDVYVAGRALDAALWGGAWRLERGADPTETASVLESAALL